eukprot:12874193-Alexandrium_andersonii.AAC.1
MSASLVGSEMCIRDRVAPKAADVAWLVVVKVQCVEEELRIDVVVVVAEPVSYTHLTLPTICSV